MELRWSGPEFIHHPKTEGWYFWISVGGGVFALLSIFFGNFIFAVFLALATIAILLVGAQHPKIVDFALTERGILIGAIFYPYESLESFWIREEEIPKIVVRNKEALSPYIILPLYEEDPDKAHSFLIQHLPEIPHEKGILESISEYLRI